MHILPFESISYIFIHNMVKFIICWRYRLYFQSHTNIPSQIEELGSLKWIINGSKTGRNRGVQKETSVFTLDIVLTYLSVFSEIRLYFGIPSILSKRWENASRFDMIVVFLMQNMVFLQIFWHLGLKRTDCWKIHI